MVIVIAPPKSQPNQSIVNPDGRTGYTPPLQLPNQSIIRRGDNGRSYSGYTPPLKNPDVEITPNAEVNLDTTQTQSKVPSTNPNVPLQKAYSVRDISLTDSANRFFNPNANVTSGKVTLGGYAEQQFNTGVQKTSNFILRGADPNKPFTRFLTRPRASGTPFDIFASTVKFGAIQPLIPTTTQYANSLISQGVIVPKSTTQFYANVIRPNAESSVSGVQVVSVTNIGNKNVLGIGKSLINTQGETSLGLGKSYTFQSVKDGTKITKLRNVGVSQEVKDFGFDGFTGVKSQSYSQELGKVKLSNGVSTPLKTNMNPIESNVFGVVKQTKPNEYLFIGEKNFMSEIPKNRFGVKGIIEDRSLSNPDVFGVIRTKTLPTIREFDSGFTSMKYSGNKPITKLETKAVTDLIGTLSKQSSKQIISNSITKIQPAEDILGLSKPVVSSYYGKGTYERTNQVNSPMSIQSQSQMNKQFNIPMSLVSQGSNQANKLLFSPYNPSSQAQPTAQIPKTSLGSGSSIANVPIQTQAPRLDTPTKTIPFIPIIPFEPTPFYPSPFPDLPSGSFESKGYSNLFKGKNRFKYTPSYSAFAYNIKGKQPKKTRFTGLELRPIPKKFSFAFKENE
jgi:hypothetical protein